VSVIHLMLTGVDFVGDLAHVSTGFTKP